MGISKGIRVLLFSFLMIIHISFSIYAADKQEGKALMMATTTSTNDTGLLDYLAPEFKKDTGIELKWISVGTGIAIKTGRKYFLQPFLNVSSR